jgi:hypothetical protein
MGWSQLPFLPHYGKRAPIADAMAVELWPKLFRYPNILFGKALNTASCYLNHNRLRIAKLLLLIGLAASDQTTQAADRHHVGILACSLLHRRAPCLRLLFSSRRNTGPHTTGLVFTRLSASLRQVNKRVLVDYLSTRP